MSAVIRGIRWIVVHFQLEVMIYAHMVENNCFPQFHLVTSAPCKAEFKFAALQTSAFSLPAQQTFYHCLSTRLSLLSLHLTLRPCFFFSFFLFLPYSFKRCILSSFTELLLWCEWGSPLTEAVLLPLGLSEASSFTPSDWLCRSTILCHCHLAHLYMFHHCQMPKVSAFPLKPVGVWLV